MVLSEVAERLMMMSGADASTSAAECGRAATSRTNEVVTTTVPAGHRRPDEPGSELADKDQTAWAFPHSKAVPSTQIQRRMTAILRATATFAFFMPIRFASFIPQALRAHHFFVR